MVLQNKVWQSNGVGSSNARLTCMTGKKNNNLNWWYNTRDERGKHSPKRKRDELDGRSKRKRLGKCYHLIG